MKQRIVLSLTNRIETELAPQNPLKYLKEKPVTEYIDTVLSKLYLYTRPKKGHNGTSIYMAELVTVIGNAVRSKLGQRRDSGLAAKTGAFVLYSFEKLGILEAVLGKGGNGHAAYVIKIKDDAIVKLWNGLPTSRIEKLPSEKPFQAWTGYKHDSGAQMVKTGNQGVLRNLNPEEHPIVFDVLNKAQAVGWNINREVYTVHLWALKNKTDAFAEIWELQDAEARTTKLREAKAIGDMAHRFLDKTFYHLYYYDFRGRKYPTTAYLHEQGSDLARGMLLRADHKPIGADGFFWLMVSIASNWAGESGRTDGAKTDKIPLRDRFEWALKNDDDILGYAEHPRVSQGWMKADKPWQFLAACIEYRKLRLWQYDQGDFENYEFPSGLEVYIDGSNNGCQHLAALTRDEFTAPHVNLVPQLLPGDLYRYVGDHVWNTLSTILASMPVETLGRAQAFIDDLIALKKQIGASPFKSEERAFLVDAIKGLKVEDEALTSSAAPVFWSRIVDAKQRRKVVKR